MSRRGPDPVPADAIAERLGLTVRDPALIERAVTHPSWSSEHGGPHYERLEFLGDSVLGFVVADLLHSAYPDRPEGDLTQMKIALVRGGTLAEMALELGLDAFVRLGRGAERSGDRLRPSVLEAVFEAVVGALYLDQGVEAARDFISRSLGKRLTYAASAARAGDAKTTLQERAQAAGLGLPSYEIVHESGPHQERVFTAEVRLDGCIMGKGSGRTKQAAQTSAAAVALQALRAGE